MSKKKTLKTIVLPILLFFASTHTVEAATAVIELGQNLCVIGQDLYAGKTLPDIVNERIVDLRHSSISGYTYPNQTPHTPNNRSKSAATDTPGAAPEKTVALTEAPKHPLQLITNGYVHSNQTPHTPNNRSNRAAIDTPGATSEELIDDLQLTIIGGTPGGLANGACLANTNVKGTPTQPAFGICGAFFTDDAKGQQHAHSAPLTVEVRTKPQPHPPSKGLLEVRNVDSSPHQRAESAVGAKSVLDYMLDTVKSNHENQKKPQQEIGKAQMEVKESGSNSSINENGESIDPEVSHNYSAAALAATSVKGIPGSGNANTPQPVEGEWTWETASDVDVNGNSRPSENGVSPLDERPKQKKLNHTTLFSMLYSPTYAEDGRCVYRKRTNTQVGNQDDERDIRVPTHKVLSTTTDNGSTEGDIPVELLEQQNDSLQEYTNAQNDKLSQNTEANLKFSTMELQYAKENKDKVEKEYHAKQQVRQNLQQTKALQSETDALVIEQEVEEVALQLVSKETTTSTTITEEDLKQVKIRLKKAKIKSASGKERYDRACELNNMNQEADDHERLAEKYNRLAEEIENRNRKSSSLLLTIGDGLSPIVYGGVSFVLCLPLIYYFLTMLQGTVFISMLHMSIMSNLRK